ncbi:hypothetical protein ACN28S_01355 [Cystobacter fuscus]
MLLAASIFGRVFWPEGVGELLRGQTEQALVEQHLRWLVEQEVIEPMPDSRFPSVTEYRFRHALVRDAAYGLVPDSHRPMGHQLAGSWLERMLEPDALVLATHFQWGQQPERAASFYTRAAERLFERNDLQGTLRCVESALACGASGEALTRLRALHAMVFFWMAQLPRALESGIPALAGLKAGSPLWCRLIGNLLVGSSISGHPEQSASLCEMLVRTTPEPEAVEPYIEAVATVGVSAVWFSEYQKAKTLLGRLMEVGAEVMAHAPVARGFMSLLDCFISYFCEARPWRAVSVAEQGRQDFSAVGSERNTTMIQLAEGAALAAAGERVGAAKMLRDALVVAGRMEQTLLAEGALFNLSIMLVDSPEQVDLQDAHAWLLEGSKRESAYPFVPGMRNALLARMTAARGALSEAESLARNACEMLKSLPFYVVFARTVLSAILLAQGRAEEAREVAELGVGELDRMGGAGVYAVAMYRRWRRPATRRRIRARVTRPFARPSGA